jgi:serine/threonine protein kinase
VTFYELLTGKLPFENTDSLELVHCHIAKNPKSICEINPNVPPIIKNIVMKLMAKNVDERYQSAFGVKVDLEKCLKNLPNFENLAGLSFELAQNDFSGQFQIPQKLYGRENEIKILLQVFERVANPQSKIENQKPKIELILIAGYSGVGKTALVREVHKPMTAMRGYFAAGKFDQYQRIPAFRIKLSLSFPPEEPPMSKKYKYPSTELSTGQRELIARLVGPLEIRGISRSVFRDVLADAEITVPKSSLDRWVRAHTPTGRIFTASIPAEQCRFWTTSSARLQPVGFCLRTTRTKPSRLPRSRSS